MSVAYRTGRDLYMPAVSDVSVVLRQGETIAVVGESGSGKSTLALAALRLLSAHRARIDGRVVFEGTDLAGLTPAQLRDVRGARAAMVFQDPMTALNPTVRVGQQIRDAIRAHTNLRGRALQDRVHELIGLVGLPDPVRIAQQYPHALSGGMCQRVVIALALSCSPTLLIADEPTTALDVTIQAQILDLLRSLQNDLGLAILLITHDLGVVAEMASHVYVMYAGRVVESGSVDDVLVTPKHPYTQALLEAVPRLDRPEQHRASPPRSVGPATGGCSYQTRCPSATAACQTVPNLGVIEKNHRVACWNWRGGQEAS
jgi:oligopeptide/dipeptide ABC transporter ATP-binding protein